MTPISRRRFLERAAVAAALGLAVLDRDYFTVPDDEIKRVRSVLTVVGGKVVHSDV